VSYLHMHMLVARHGQPGWAAALTPLSVDGMILAASTTLLAGSRSGGHGGTFNHDPHAHPGCLHLSSLRTQAMFSRARSFTGIAVVR
jgi:Protein of unknown function (DUF2637)